MFSFYYFSIKADLENLKNCKHKRDARKCLVRIRDLWAKTGAYTASELLSLGLHYRHRGASPEICLYDITDFMHGRNIQDMYNALSYKLKVIKEALE